MSLPRDEGGNEGRAGGASAADESGAAQAASGDVPAEAERVAKEKARFEALRAFMAEHIPFNKFLGMELTALRHGYARLELPFRPEFIGDPFRPALHGGVLSTMADTCGGAATFSVVSIHDRVSTVDLRIDYLRPGRQEHLVCEGRIVRAGNRVCVVNLRLFHPGAEGEHIAEATAVYNISRARSAERPPE